MRTTTRTGDRRTRTASSTPPLRTPRRPIATVLALVLATTSLSVLGNARPAAAATPTVAITQRISVGSGGTEANSNAHPDPLTDATGRFVFFTTSFSFVAADADALDDVYRRDRWTSQLELVTTPPKVEANPAHNVLCGLSATGRYLVYQTSGDALPSTIQNQLWLRDLTEGTTTLVSTGSGGVAEIGAEHGGLCSVSSDGKRVAFASAAKSLTGDGNDVPDAFVRKVDAGTTVKVSKSTGGTSGNGGSGRPVISDSGDVVVFVSIASNLAAGDANATWDTYVHTLSTGTTERISSTSGGQAAEGQSASISATGRYVAFTSLSNTLVADDDNGARDVFRKDRQTGTIERVSVSTAGAEGNGPSTSTDISADGRYVAFTSDATNLYPADGNGSSDVFRRDLLLGRTDLVSRRWTGVAPGNGNSWTGPSVSGNGNVITFATFSTDLVPGDGNAKQDIYVRDFALSVAPFNSPKAFATQQLKDFGDEKPATATIDSATTRLQQGLDSPDSQVVARSRGVIWAGKKPALIRLYWAFFLRPPDKSGMTYWVNQLLGGKTLAKVAAQFAQSSEFQNTYGSKTNSEFVTLIYQNIFERDPDAGGLAYWTAKLDAKQKTRGDVMTNFSESSEGKRLLQPQVDIIDIALGMVKRMPTAIEFSDMLADRKDGQPAELTPAYYRTLPEYAARITA